MSTEPSEGGRQPRGSDGRAATPAVVPVKVRPPTQRMDVVSRPRLIRALDETPARIVLVSAPAGFGKTVLVLDWLARRAAPVAWLSLDALDNHPERFVTHLAAAFEAASPVPSTGSSGTVSPERVRRSSDSGADPTDAPRTAFTRAAGVLSDGVHRVDEELAVAAVRALEEVADGATLVLDDVHLLTAPAVWGFLGRLVGDGPEGLRIVFLTREDPPLRLARLRVSGELLEVRTRELRFRADECAHFFDAVGAEGLSAARIGELVERTEGWAAGLRLAAAALQTSDDIDAAAAAFGGRHELLVDYLLEEALRGRSPELQRFLMETSILPRFTVEGCRRVTGDPACAARLDEVDQANLFLISLDAERRWYRYHHLFAELLTYRLERLAPGRVPLLRERASLWFESQGQLSEALEQAAHLDDRTHFVRLLDRHGYAMLARSEFAVFAHWLRQVADPGAWRWPLFLVAVTWYHVQVDRRAELDAWLERLDAALARPPGGYPEALLAEARLHREVIRAFWLRVHGRMDEALAAAERVLEKVPTNDVVLRGMTEFHVAAVKLRLGDMPGARADLERARDTTRPGGAEYIFLASLGHLTAVLTQTEGVAVARQHFREAIAQAEARRLDRLPAFGIVLYQAADTCLVADECDAARAFLEHADEVTRGERDTDIRANVLIRQARLRAGEGERAAAEALLDEAAVISRGQSLQPFGTTIELERARLEELGGGVLTTPDTVLAGEDAAVEGWTIVREAEAVLRMRHALKAGRAAEAEARAVELTAESERRRRGVAHCLALLTRATLSTDPAARHEFLADALDRAWRGGWVRPVVDFGASVRPALEAAAAGGLPDAVQRFVRAELLTRLPAAGGAGPSVDLVAELGLTEREVDLLGHLAEGLTNRVLARRLFVSENTVKTHLKHIYAKLDVSNRTAAVKRARALGLFSAGGD